MRIRVNRMNITKLFGLGLASDKRLAILQNLHRSFVWSAFTTSPILNSLKSLVMSRPIDVNIQHDPTQTHGSGIELRHDAYDPTDSRI